MYFPSVPPGILFSSFFAMPVVVRVRVVSSCSCSCSRNNKSSTSRLDPTPTLNNKKNPSRITHGSMTWGGVRSFSSSSSSSFCKQSHRSRWCTCFPASASSSALRAHSEEAWDTFDRDADADLGGVGFGTPLLTALTERASSLHFHSGSSDDEKADMDEVPFYTPGHKRGNLNLHDDERQTHVNASLHPLLALDVPELEEVDNLFAPTGVIKQAQQLTARLYGAATTMFSVNGSTAGVAAAILATCDEKRALVLPRDAHQSALNGLVLSGAKPVYLPAHLVHGGDVSNGTNAEDVEQALATNQGDVGAVLVVSPTYHGMCADVKAIAQVCQRHGVPLLVDEAHGAHLGLCDLLPASALQCGADVAVQSTHKALGALSQCAVVHLAHDARVSEDTLRQALLMLTSTSPNYALLASIDSARAAVDGDHGKRVITRATELAIDTRRRIIDDVAWRCLPSDDPWKITVLLEDADSWCGDTLDDFLCDDHGVVCELARNKSVLFAWGIGSTQEHANRLVDALGLAREAMLSSSSASRQATATAAMPPLSSANFSMTPRAAFFARKERIPLEQAVGRVSAESLAPYPPGIPLVLPGETLTADMLDALKAFARQGGAISGASDPSMCTVRVLL